MPPINCWTSVYSLFCVFTIVSHCNAITEHQISPRTIKIKYGNLRGLLINFSNKNLQPVEMFLGIPYASPPIGKLRFMPPVTPAIWSGVRNCNSFGPVCPQRFPEIGNETEALQRMTKGRLKILKKIQTMLRNQSEDCLYLNIYTPANSNRENARLPVLVFIHGESYEWNAGSSYDGSVLASEANLVVVTINFRLGILGFFPSLGGSARGNFGLMDQVAALHWIQENIREFSGDERNVTIIGYGHGAACVNFLMISPMARGLFHRAIMMSGSALSPWAIASDAMLHAKTVAATVGCGDQANINNVLDCLRQKPVQDIVSVDLKVPTHLTAFGPVIDGIVIPGDPQVLMSKPNSIFANYQLLFGVSKVESFNLFSMYDERHGIDMARRDRLLRTLVRNLFDYHLQEIFLTILNEYTDWTRPFFHPISLFDSLVDIFSDALVVAPTLRVGMLHAKQSRSTFFYIFVHQTENGDYNPRLGCIHGQDLSYLFGAPLVNGIPLAWFSQNYTQAEVNLSEQFIKFIASFTKTGNPNNNQQAKPNSISSNTNINVANIYWNPYEEIQQKYISFGTKINVQDHYLAHRLSYWFNLLPQLHKRGTTTDQEHHLLESHNNIMTYDGIVRYGSLSAPLSFNTYFSPDNGSSASGDSQLMPGSPMVAPNQTSHVASHGHNETPSDENDSLLQSAFDSSYATKQDHGNASFSMIIQSGNYSTALSLTIAIGCSLLILNILVFAGIFYQKDRNRLETKLIRNKKSQTLLPPSNKSNTSQQFSSVPLCRINSISDDYNQRADIKCQ